MLAEETPDSPGLRGGPAAPAWGAALAHPIHLFRTIARPWARTLTVVVSPSTLRASSEPPCPKPLASPSPLAP